IIRADFTVFILVTFIQFVRYYVSVSGRHLLFAALCEMNNRYLRSDETDRSGAKTFTRRVKMTMKG
ncbi:hypothetical protein ACOIC7_28440, partial [Klebsiella pneumoniae]|uniref:hypothetical protein n=1 Tax=Klebsiella pneumoniae TaxID=573 RepID=UPI003B58C5A2